MARWRNGLDVGLAIKRSRVRILVAARLRNDSGQVVHTLSPSSIISYRSTGGDAVRLGGKIAVGLASHRPCCSTDFGIVQPSIRAQGLPKGEELAP